MNKIEKCVCPVSGEKNVRDRTRQRKEEKKIDHLSVSLSLISPLSSCVNIDDGEKITRLVLGPIVLIEN